MCETTYYLLWNASAISKWEQGLGILLNPWIEQYIPRLGISPQLRSALEQWEPIYSLMKSELSLARLNVDPIESYRSRYRLIVVGALKKLAELCGDDVAYEIDRWVRRHFFCEYLGIRLRVWRRLLSVAYRFDVASERRIQPPHSLTSMLHEDRISDLIRKEDIRESLRVIGSSIKEQSQDNPLIADGSAADFEILTFSRIVDECTTIQLLQEISRKLSFWEIQDVVRWAIMQASIGRSIDQILIGGDTLIREEPPCHNALSILNMYGDVPI
jgi:hypothetical protein